MRIAVFGGSGYIGAQVCKTLIACGCAVTSISRSGNAALGARFEAKAAGAKRFVYVGVGSECQMGFGGPNPGLYTGKRDAALAARDAFGDQFTFIGPHAVVESKNDARIKAANSGFGKGLNAVNDFFGEIRSFGPDYAAKTKLAAPCPVDDVALAIAASVMGKVEVEETMRAAGVTTLDATRESEQYEIRDMMRHVDGTAAISELAARAQREGMTL